jgi:predicted nucleic acid-binding protein
MSIPLRVFLDTNVYIVGVANSTSAEWKILEWLGFESHRSDAAEVVISAEVIEQILRVAKRLKNKDVASIFCGVRYQGVTCSVSMSAASLTQRTCYSKGVEPRVPDDYLPADLYPDAATTAADHV